MHPLVPSFQMPPKQPPKHRIPIFLDHIPVARNNPLKLPLRNPLRPLIKPRLIPRKGMPHKPLPPAPIHICNMIHNLIQGPIRLRTTGLAELFVCRQIEKQICLYQRLAGLVKQNNLLVRMPVPPSVLLFNSTTNLNCAGKTHISKYSASNSSLMPTGSWSSLLPFLNTQSILTSSFPWFCRFSYSPSGPTTSASFHRSFQGPIDM